MKYKIKGKWKTYLPYKPGTTYKVKMLKEISVFGGDPWKKGSIQEIDNWHMNGTSICRKDWHNKLVICGGHGMFCPFEPNVDIEVIGEIK